MARRAPDRSDRDPHDYGDHRGEASAHLQDQAALHEKAMREGRAVEQSVEGLAYNPDQDHENRLRSEEARQQAELKEQDKEQGTRAGRHGAAAQGQGQAHGTDKQQQSQKLAREPGQPKNDGFETQFTRPSQQVDKKTAINAPQAAPPPRTSGGSGAGGAIEALNNAQDPGLYFKEDLKDGQRGDEARDDPEDVELALAVEECIRMLFGVRGIHRVGPGRNDLDERIIVISVNKGFTESSMRAIPGQVHRFRTLCAIPYDLLPLKRDA